MRLAELMRKHGYSFQDLADEAGVAKSSIVRIVSGTAKKLHPSTMRKIAKVFGVPLEEVDEFAFFQQNQALPEEYRISLKEWAELKTDFAEDEADQLAGVEITVADIKRMVAQMVAEKAGV